VRYVKLRIDARRPRWPHSSGEVNLCEPYEANLNDKGCAMFRRNGFNQIG
jgi:hypothetical protein